MRDMSKLCCLIGLVTHAIWVDSLYFLYLLLHHSSKEAGAVMSAAHVGSRIQEVHTNPSTSPVTLQQASPKVYFDVQRMKSNCILFVYNWDNGSAWAQQSSSLTLLIASAVVLWLVNWCSIGSTTYINGHKRILLDSLHFNKDFASTSGSESYRIT
jgi:hypothetical protein